MMNCSQKFELAVKQVGTVVSKDMFNVKKLHHKSNFKIFPQSFKVKFGPFLIATSCFYGEN